MTVMNRAWEGSWTAAEAVKSTGESGRPQTRQVGAGPGPCRVGEALPGEEAGGVESISLAKTNKHIAYINHTL